MTEIQALILGLIQGLTEFLPVSSSGHLEIGGHFLHLKNHDNLSFSIMVHAATVMSTIVVFRKDIFQLLQSVFQFKWNDDTRFISYLLVSAIPVGIMGVFFKSEVESFFEGNLVLVGGCLLFTATILTFAHFKKGTSIGNINYKNSIIIGLAQAVAVLPGISRSGSTIAAGLLLGIDRKEVARFSFLMVLLPILGAAFLDLVGSDSVSEESIGAFPLLLGFISAFVAGLLACKLMIKVVSSGKLIYFAIYCLIIGLIAIFAG